MKGIARSARAIPLFTLVMGVLLVPASLGFGYAQHVRATTDLQQDLRRVARDEASALANYFERAKSIVLLTAQNPSFADFYETPGSREKRVLQQGPALMRTYEALAYLEQLYPTSIGEACFIDVSGAENSRVVRGVYAGPDELSPDESFQPFFHPTFELPAGSVYQARPYVSPDTGEWVISNSTKLSAKGGRSPAIVHYEVTVESFRREAASRSAEARVYVLDQETGQIVIDTSVPQRIGAGLGVGPIPELRSAIAGAGGRAGQVEVGGETHAFERLPAIPGNASKWVVVAASEGPTGLLASTGLPPLGLLLVAFVLLGAGIVTFRSGQRDLNRAAYTDSLTGLFNRRRLMADLAGRFDDDAPRPFTLAFFDLNGFKQYNDTFGHFAGDALLLRLAHKLSSVVGSRGSTYRLGGDEFCLVTDLVDRSADALVAAGAVALSERGEGFVVTAAKGSVTGPSEAAGPSELLRLADMRMYDDKLMGRPSPERQSRDVLLTALHERYPELRGHLDQVGRLSEMLARRVGLAGEQLDKVRQAGELHDVGKVAIPDTILLKTGPLDPEEWEFMKSHTVVGERILEVAPALAWVAKLVRSHHERVDGTGYPSGLEGEEIPLGSRIVAVCDAYHAMVAGRPYRAARSHEEAIEELRRYAGTQFDAALVEIFCASAEEARAICDGVELGASLH